MHAGRDHWAYVLFILHHFCPWLLTLTRRYSLNVNSVIPTAFRYILWSWKLGQPQSLGEATCTLNIFQQSYRAHQMEESDAGVAAAGEVIITVNHRPKADWKPSLLCSNCFLFLHTGHHVKRSNFTGCEESSLSFLANYVKRNQQRESWGNLKERISTGLKVNIVFLCFMYFHIFVCFCFFSKSQKQKFFGDEESPREQGLWSAN